MNKVDQSLARIEGQIRGIRQMATAKKSCLELVQQIAAARQALARVGRELLNQEVCQCMVKESEKKKFDKILKQNNENFAFKSGGMLCQ